MSKLHDYVTGLLYGIIIGSIIAAPLALLVQVYLLTLWLIIIAIISILCLLWYNKLEIAKNPATENIEQLPFILDNSVENTQLLLRYDPHSKELSIIQKIPRHFPAPEWTHLLTEISQFSDATTLSLKFCMVLKSDLPHIHIKDILRKEKFHLNLLGNWFQLLEPSHLECFLDNIPENCTTITLPSNGLSEHDKIAAIFASPSYIKINNLGILLNGKDTNYRKIPYTQYEEKIKKYCAQFQTATVINLSHTLDAIWEFCPYILANVSTNFILAKHVASLDISHNNFKELETKNPSRFNSLLYQISRKKLLSLNLSATHFTEISNFTNIMKMLLRLDRLTDLNLSSNDLTSIEHNKLHELMSYVECNCVTVDLTKINFALLPRDHRNLTSDYLLSSKKLLHLKIDASCWIDSKVTNFKEISLLQSLEIRHAFINDHQAYIDTLIAILSMKTKLTKLAIDLPHVPEQERMTKLFNVIPQYLISLEVIIKVPNEDNLAIYPMLINFCKQSQLQQLLFDDRNLNLHNIEAQQCIAKLINNIGSNCQIQLLSSCLTALSNDNIKSLQSHNRKSIYTS